MAEYYTPNIENYPEHLESPSSGTENRYPHPQATSAAIHPNALMYNNNTPSNNNLPSLPHFPSLYPPPLGPHSMFHRDNLPLYGATAAAAAFANSYHPPPHGSSMESVSSTSASGLTAGLLYSSACHGLNSNLLNFYSHHPMASTLTGELNEKLYSTSQPLAPPPPPVQQPLSTNTKHDSTCSEDNASFTSPMPTGTSSSSLAKLPSSSSSALKKKQTSSLGCGGGTMLLSNRPTEALFIRLLLPACCRLAPYWFKGISILRERNREESKRASCNAVHSTDMWQDITEAIKSGSVSQQNEVLSNLLKKLYKELPPESVYQFLLCWLVPQECGMGPEECVLSRADLRGKMRRIDGGKGADKVWRLDTIVGILFHGLPLASTDTHLMWHVCGNELCIRPQHLRFRASAVSIALVLKLLHQAGYRIEPPTAAAAATATVSNNSTPATAVRLQERFDNRDSGNAAGHGDEYVDISGPFNIEEMLRLQTGVTPICEKTVIKFTLSQTDRDFLNSRPLLKRCLIDMPTDTKEQISPPRLGEVVVPSSVVTVSATSSSYHNNTTGPVVPGSGLGAGVGAVNGNHSEVGPLGRSASFSGGTSARVVQRRGLLQPCTLNTVDTNSNGEDTLATAFRNNPQHLYQQVSSTPVRNAPLPPSSAWVGYPVAPVPPPAYLASPMEAKHSPWQAPFVPPQHSTTSITGLLNLSFRERNIKCEPMTPGSNSQDTMTHAQSQPGSRKRSFQIQGTSSGAFAALAEPHRKVAKSDDEEGVQEQIQEHAHVEETRYSRPPSEKVQVHEELVSRVHEDMKMEPLSNDDVPRPPKKRPEARTPTRDFIERPIGPSTILFHARSPFISISSGSPNSNASHPLKANSEMGSTAVDFSTGPSSTPRHQQSLLTPHPATVQETEGDIEELDSEDMELANIMGAGGTGCKLGVVSDETDGGNVGTKSLFSCGGVGSSPTTQSASSRCSLTAALDQVLQSPVIRAWFNTCQQQPTHITGGASTPTVYENLLSLQRNYPVAPGTQALSVDSIKSALFCTSPTLGPLPGMSSQQPFLNLGLGGGLFKSSTPTFGLGLGNLDNSAFYTNIFQSLSRAASRNEEHPPGGGGGLFPLGLGDLSQCSESGGRPVSASLLHHAAALAATSFRRSCQRPGSTGLFSDTLTTPEPLLHLGGASFTVPEGGEDVMGDTEGGEERGPPPVNALGATPTKVTAVHSRSSTSSTSANAAPEAEL